MKCKCSWECAIIAVMVVFVLYPSTMYFVYINRTFEEWYCLGPPYLYVTYHGQVNGPVKYSRDGCSLSGNLLLGVPFTKDDYFRSMAVSANNNLFLAVSNANGNFGSKVLQYGACDSYGYRRIAHTVVEQSINTTDGVSHPYGIALQNNPDGSVNQVYASFQDTDVVLRFSVAPDGSRYFPAALPLALSSQKKKKRAKYYPGTFFQIGDPNDHEVKKQGVRSIVFVGPNLWIADEAGDRVHVVNPDGYVLRKIKVRRPIGMYYSAQTNTVFVGSKSSYGLVYGFNSTYGVSMRYHTQGMLHPAGLVAHENSLYVLEQKAGRLYEFNIATGRLEKTILSGLASQAMEQIALSPC